MPAASPSLQHSVQQKAYRIVLWQIGGVMTMALIALSIKGAHTGFSVLMGGMAYGLLNLVFVWAVFRFVGAHQVMNFLAAFFAGEAIKLVLSGVLILLIVKYLPVSLLSVVVGFIGAIVLFWVACFIEMR